jgi:glycosyltransferase involved in cell wall biosynthesis
MKTNLIFFLPEFIRGGAGNSILSLCKNLNKNKYKIHIICLNKFNYKEEFKNLAKISILNAKKTIFSQNQIQKLILKISNNNCINTIFISNLFHANVLIGLFQKKFEKVKYVFVDRTSFNELYTYFGFFDFIKKIIIRILIKFTYKNAILRIANSKKVSLDIENFTNLKCSYIYPGAFTKAKKKKMLKNKKKIFKNKLKILWIGRLSEEKDCNELILALSKITKKNYTLSIIGDGEKKNEIKKLIIEKKLQKNVRLSGYKKNVFKLLQTSDLLINTSYFEGFPNVIIEALICNVPIISSKSGGGVMEILKNGKYGDLYKKNDVKSLINKINLHINNPIRLYKKSSLGRKDLNRFSDTISAKKYEKIFERIKF